MAAHGRGARALWPSGRVLLARRERQAFYQYFESCSTLHRSKTCHGHRVLREPAAQRQHSPRASVLVSRLSGTMTGRSPGLERGAGRVRGFSARLSSSESKTVTRTLVCAGRRLAPTARGDRARTLAGTRSAKPLLRNTRETGSAGTGRLGPGERRRDAGGKAGRNGATRRLPPLLRPARLQRDSEGLGSLVLLLQVPTRSSPGRPGLLGTQPRTWTWPAALVGFFSTLNNVKKVPEVLECQYAERLHSPTNPSAPPIPAHERPGGVPGSPA